MTCGPIRPARTSSSGSDGDQVALSGQWLRTALLGLALAGCSGAGAASTVEPATVAVVISTASGEALRFEPAEASVVAAGPIQVTFLNRSSQAHNLVFTSGVSAATRTIVEAGGWDRVVFVPPGPGEYSFVCTIHAGMQGSLEIEAPTASIP